MSQRKLQSVNVFDIRNSKQSDTLLAAAYAVSRKTIYNIKNGLRYKNVGPKTLKSYPGIRVFNDGWVLNKKNVVLATNTGDTVRVTNRKGKRERVQVSTLVNKAFG